MCKLNIITVDITVDDRIGVQNQQIRLKRNHIRLSILSTVYRWRWPMCKLNIITVDITVDDRIGVQNQQIRLAGQGGRRTFTCFDLYNPWEVSGFPLRYRESVARSDRSPAHS